MVGEIRIVQGEKHSYNVHIDEQIILNVPYMDINVKAGACPAVTITLFTEKLTVDTSESVDK